MYKKLSDFIREIYRTNDFIPLHEPSLGENELNAVQDCIRSGYVSSVGSMVNLFESEISKITGIENSIATVNGTAALHLALKISGAETNTEVVTQSLSFIATTNAIAYCGASPVFIDVDLDTLSLCPRALSEYLETNCEVREDGYCWNNSTQKRVVACLVMHTFGFPAKIPEISQICQKYGLKLVEDSAEAIGSYEDNIHVGSNSDFSILSFNGNKIITTGGGGMIQTNDQSLAEKARHLSTTARTKREYFFEHDEIGFNYRLPNLNAALGIGQLKSLQEFLCKKRWLAKLYQEWGAKNEVNFVKERKNTRANYWLNALLLSNKSERDDFLTQTNSCGIQTRPVWVPIHMLPMYSACEKDSLENTEWLANRLVNIPSSPVPYEIS